MNNFLDSLPRSGGYGTMVDTDKIAPPVGPPMTVEMLRERGSILLKKLLADRADSELAADETIEGIVNHLGQICIAGRTANEYHERRELAAAASYFSSILSL
jgi:hypothetical protein